MENLRDVLTNKDLVYLFRQFLHELYMSENLAFWFEVEEYKKDPPEERLEHAKEIYEKYFNPKSKYELNVEGKLKKEVAEKYTTGSPDVFDAIQQSIWKVMEHDSFPKFLQSPAYKKYKETGKLDYDKAKISQEVEEIKARPRSRSSTVWMVENYFEGK